MERVIDMNVEMAYLTGMILGNGEIQRGVKDNHHRYSLQESVHR